MLVEQELSRKRLKQFELDVEPVINTKSNKIESAVSAQQALLTQRAHADEALIEQMKAEDDIALPHTEMELSQQPVIISHMQPVMVPPVPYEPVFFSNVANAVLAGADLFQS